MSEQQAEMDAIVSRLTTERAKRGLSLREVARASGVSVSCVHTWEHGVRAPSLHNLRAWAASLGYDLILTPTFRNAEWPPVGVDASECVGFPPRVTPPESSAR
jgi:transcriptional regulator with XRE-family HTH domain